METKYYAVSYVVQELIIKHWRERDPEGFARIYEEFTDLVCDVLREFESEIPEMTVEELAEKLRCVMAARGRINGPAAS